MIDEAPDVWHETDELADGTPIAKLGGLWYIVDDDGEPTTDGYHDIWFSEGLYVAKRGSRRCVLTNVNGGRFG